jgi:hypothetical protein
MYNKEEIVERIIVQNFQNKGFKNKHAKFMRKKMMNWSDSTLFFEFNQACGGKIKKVSSNKYILL